MIYKKQYDCIQILLSNRNINVNLWGRRGYTPLMLAVELGQKDIVELLLRHKDININACMGRFYERSCREMNALSVAKAKRHGDIVELLLAHGAKDTAPAFL
jgi:ankyrin repeat protein